MYFQDCVLFSFIFFLINFFNNFIYVYGISIVNTNIVGNYIAVEVDTILIWSDANDFCISEYGTSLATIRNENENNDVQSALNGLSYLVGFGWIGLFDLETNDGNFEWIDGTTYDESLSYNSFGFGSNTLDNRDSCVDIERNFGTWDNYFCSFKYRAFICNLVDSTNTFAPSEEPTQEPRRLP